jgi:hypothetical protein
MVSFVQCMIMLVLLVCYLLMSARVAIVSRVCYVVDQGLPTPSQIVHG